MSSYARANLRITNQKQKENSHEGITWSEMGKQNVQAEKVYSAPESRIAGTEIQVFQNENILIPD